MAEPTIVTETVTPVPESDQVSTTEVQNTQEEPFDAERAKALINKLRDEVKALKPIEKQYQELKTAEEKRKEAEMTELERAQKRIAELEGMTKAQARREMQRSAAEKYHLPAAVAELIPGDTQEDIDKKAEELSRAIPQKQTPTLNPTNPAGQAQETEEQKRARLFGNYQDIFKGGGVNFPQNLQE